MPNFCESDSDWEKLTQLLGLKRTWTTAYHSIANGHVEHFHRQLKAALKTQAHPEHWTDALPIVLLVIHTALKEDIRRTAAEFIYGLTLYLPGEFVSPTSNILEVSTDYVAQLKSDKSPPQQSNVTHSEQCVCQPSPRNMHVYPGSA